VGGRHGLLGALPALGCASLAALAYAGTVEWIAPELSLLLPLLAVFLAAAIASIAGFAFAPISAVMLVHLVDDPVRVVSMILFGSITMQSFCLISLWREMDWPAALVAAIGGLATLPLGLMLLLAMTGRTHVVVLGAMLILYSCWMLWRPKDAPAKRLPRWAIVMAGAAGGITGGLAAFPSAPLTACYGWRGVGRVAFRGTVQPYILIMQVAALLLLHLLTPARAPMSGFDPTLLLVAGPALFGTICGLQLYGRLSDRHFARVMNLMLLAAGIGMLA